MGKRIAIGRSRQIPTRAIRGVSITLSQVGGRYSEVYAFWLTANG
jgi:hypothetical protein